MNTPFVNGDFALTLFENNNKSSLVISLVLYLASIRTVLPLIGNFHLFDRLLYDKTVLHPYQKHQIALSSNFQKHILLLLRLFLVYI